MPAKWKIKEVEELSKKLDESPVVAVATVTALPSKQMQEIRKKLNDLDIKVVKNRLAKRAFEKSSKKGLKELAETINGPTALVFAKEDPFKLYQRFVQNRVKAPAKNGDIAPEDIVVPAGDTPFKPGPIIADLQEVGIKAKIQGPIIAVMSDSPVIKAGEKFSGKLANVLAQLDIFPMEIGLNVLAVLEDGTVYEKAILDIDKEQTLADIIKAHQNALNLSVEAGILNKESVSLLLTKAASNARNLALEAEIYNKETVDYFLSKADREAKGLAAAASYTPSAAPVEKAEEKKEEPAAESKEEKKEEAPAEEKKEEAKEEKPAEEKEEVPAGATEEAKETDDTTQSDSQTKNE